MVNGIRSTIFVIGTYIIVNSEIRGQKMMLNDDVNDSDNVDDVKNKNVENIVNNTTYEFKDIPNIPDNAGRAHVKVNIPVSILKKFHKYSIEQVGESIYWDDHVAILIHDYNLKFDKQHLSASLIFDGRKPRRDVLLKLDKIAEEFKCESSFPKIHKNWISKIICKVLGNPDMRTLQKYIKCIKGYANATNSIPDVYWDFQNFQDTIKDKLDNV